MAGHVTPAGVFVEVGAARLPLPVARTPVGEWVAQVIADIDSGDLTPCPHCGEWGGCDCVDWLTWMATAQHAPLDEMTDEDLPY
jgi:hypothetical protein